MAEALLKHGLKKAEVDVEVFSRGTSALFGQKVSENSVVVLRELGIDASAHQARPLERNDVRRADVILAMEENHLRNVLRNFPEAEGKIFLLKEYAGIKDGWPEVADPVGLPVEEYRRTRKELEQVTGKLIEKLTQKEPL